MIRRVQPALAMLLAMFGLPTFDHRAPARRPRSAWLDGSQRPPSGGPRRPKLTAELLRDLNRRAAETSS